MPGKVCGSIGPVPVAATRQPKFFGDFNGVPLKERIDFYRDPMHWTNRLIQATLAGPA